MNDQHDETFAPEPDPEQPERTEQLEQAESQPLGHTGPYGEPEPMPIPEPAPQRRTGSHPVNVGQLAMGLVFLAAVGVWALIQGDVVTGDEIRWLLPVPWVIGGGIGLVAAAISSVRRHGVGR